jgi:hypothetical protein
MQPIVHGLETEYHACVGFERISILEQSLLKQRLRPFGTPEFFLLAADGQVIYRWIGLTYASEFEAVLRPRCTAG